jgi:hypothetical protein
LGWEIAFGYTPRMATNKPIDPSHLNAGWSLQRVRKPSGKLFPGPPLGPKGDWRVKLFMDNYGGLYERHRVIAYEKPVERWFAVTSFEATFEEPPRSISKSVGSSEKKPRKSKLDRAAEKNREAEVMLRYSTSLQFGDLVDELEFAITENLFGDDGQRLIRRAMRLVVDARMLFYRLGEPPPTRRPTRTTPTPAPIVPSATNTIQ